MISQTQGSSHGNKAVISTETAPKREHEHTGQKAEKVAQGAIIPFVENPGKILEEKVFQAIRSENHFNREERENFIRMGSLAALMYKDFEGLEAVSALFPRALLPMKSPEDLGISEPAGLRVQAFRHGDQVIIAIRGTELNKEKSILFNNLIADAGIGRHKSNEDLLESIRRVSRRTSSVHGFDLDEKHLAMAENIINSRIQGHSDVSRLGNMAKRLVTATGRGMAKGGAIGTIGGILLGGGAIAAGLASAPIAGGLVLTAMAVSGLTGATATSIKEGAVLTTAADGYPVLLSYIDAIDDYVVALKDAECIKEKDELITVGHSLAGYLAGVIGALHGDEIYSFNGPGVNFDEEMPEIIYNMGKKRSIQALPSYHSVSMETDFIGNLTRRTGGLRKLYLPLTSKEQCGSLPPSHYGNPLAHHGIDLMVQVLKTTSVSEIPLIRLPQAKPPLLLTDRPRVEVIDEEDSSKLDKDEISSSTTTI